MVDIHSYTHFTITNFRFIKTLPKPNGCWVFTLQFVHLQSLCLPLLHTMLFPWFKGTVTFTAVEGNSRVGTIVKVSHIMKSYIKSAWQAVNNLIDISCCSSMKNLDLHVYDLSFWPILFLFPRGTFRYVPYSLLVKQEIRSLLVWFKQA